jgi:hypothetical protein
VVTITLPTAVTAATVRLLNVAGLETYRQALPPGPPTKALRMSVSDVPDGVYVAVIEGLEGTMTVPLLVRH